MKINTQLGDKVFSEDYLEKLKIKVEKNKGNRIQKRFQEDAIETAKMFNDKESMGIYMKLFQKHDRERLIAARDWVLSKGKNDLGRLFVSVYKKFLL